ncbi:MAG: bacteriohemerythrin [Dissulfurispiraceae bacterium]|jgi:hemerythrin|nr:bacteriohemerythrin [Dissulfurispiraceae bacterium]
MAFITWSEELSVNVQEIDQQHKKLVHMINELHEAMKQGQGPQTLGEIINRMSSYAVTHFATEENYFGQFGYPGTTLHKKEHSAFIKKISEFKDGFENGKLALTIEVLNFLKEWLQNHIKKTDKQYSLFFNEMGLK